MELQFVKMNPTRNMTILVETPVPRAKHGEIAKQLMAEGSVCAEQVGYIEPPLNPAAAARLQMMGGEFCGNASMSLATLLAMHEGLENGKSADYALEVSGANDIVHCTVRRENRAYIGEVDMPLPERIGMTTLDDVHRYPLVCFPGIVHLIVPEDELTKDMAEKFAPTWCRKLHADALGILLTDESHTHMRPLVYVLGSDSAVWECGCGSGTAALGAYRAYSTGNDAEVNVSQPGGTICASAQMSDGRIDALRIRGRVLPVCAGTAWVDAG